MKEMTTAVAHLSDERPRARRWVLAALLLALMWAAISSRGDAQSAATVRVVGPTATVPVGQPFMVTMVMENAQDLGAFEFEYNFNPTVAATTVNDIQLGSLLGSSGRTTGQLRLASAPGRPGTPLFGAYSYGAGAGPNGSGVLATVAMTAAGPGVSPLNLTGLKVTNARGDEYPVASVAGSVTVVNAPRLIYLPLLRRSH
jgi:hypothetical protein